MPNLFLKLMDCYSKVVIETKDLNKNPPFQKSYE